MDGTTVRIDSHYTQTQVGVLDDGTPVIDYPDGEVDCWYAVPADRYVDYDDSTQMLLVWDGLEWTETCMTRDEMRYRYGEEIDNQDDVTEGGPVLTSDDAGYGEN